jgi:hypothetical protein
VDHKINEDLNGKGLPNVNQLIANKVNANTYLPAFLLIYNYQCGNGIKLCTKVSSTKSFFLRVNMEGF